MTPRPRVTPDYSAIRDSVRSRNLFVRSAVAELLRYQRRGIPTPLDEVLERHFPAEQRREVQLITRTDADPATTTANNWASPLVQTTVADFLMTLGPASAGSTLLRKCLTFQFDRNAAILVPDIVTAAGSAKFIKEAAPIPVVDLSFGNKTLLPRKFAIITTFVRELLEQSVGNIEQTVGLALRENIGLALDSVMFSSDAEVTDVSPAGLLKDLAGLTPSTSETAPMSEALSQDIAALTAAVAPVAANAGKIFIASPRQYDRLYRALYDFPIYEVLMSNALADGTVICVASNAICAVIAADLSFDVSDKAVLVMTDTGSEMVAATGGTSVAADPMRSLFQTDTLALKTRLSVSWALRNATGLSFMENVTW